MIVLDGVRFSYGRGRDVVRVGHLEIPGGLTLLLGPNGAGKSTLLRLLAGVERPREGKIAIDGFDLWSEEVESRRNLAYVPEQPELTPYATIEEIVRLTCHLRGLDVAAGTAAIARVGLEREAGRSVRELSQGQRRRAVMAAAFVGSPGILLLDEPLEAMDRAMRGDIVGWIREAAGDGRTVVVASHEFDELSDAVGAALEVRDGEVALHAVPEPGAERDALLDRLARGAGA